MSEIIETRENFRVVAVQDLFPGAPDHDGQGYVFGVDIGWRVRADLMHKDSDAPDPGFDLADAYARLRDWELVERYLRMFFDVVGFDTRDPHRSGPTYVLVVTWERVGTWGLTGEDFATTPDVATRGTLDTWEAWATGDTWAWRVEERVTTTMRNASGEVVEEYADWHEVDSCWGYYGEADLKSAAILALDDHEPMQA